MKKKLISIALMIIMVFSIIPFGSIHVSAATSASLYNSLNVKLPIATHATPLSGASKVYSYTNSSLTTKQTSYYIDTFIDQIVITNISSDGKAVYVTYPSSSSSTGYRSLWFASDDILGISTISISSYNASSSVTTYSLASASSVTSYGSIAVNDACTKLGSRAVGGTTYYPTVYPISSQTINKVSNVKNKLALSKTSGSSTTSTWKYPIDGAKCSWSGYKAATWSWSEPSNDDYNSTARVFHLGLDLMGSNDNIKATSAGKVIKVGNNSANGNYVVIQSTLSGKTIYQFYAHLDSYSVSSGTQVSTGTKIGVMGNTGSSSQGKHLHFAIVDTLWSGSYYGYATKFSGNKISYDGVTYYNPKYIIENNKLP